MNVSPYFTSYRISELSFLENTKERFLCNVRCLWDGGLTEDVVSAAVNKASPRDLKTYSSVTFYTIKH